MRRIGRDGSYRRILEMRRLVLSNSSAAKQEEIFPN